MLSDGSVVHASAGPIGEATERVSEAVPPVMESNLGRRRGSSSSGSSSGSEVDQEQVTAEMFEATRQLRGEQQNPQHQHTEGGHGVGDDLDMEGVRLDFNAQDYANK